MAGRAASCLRKDPRHFDDEADDGHVGGEASQPPPGLHESEQPDESEAVHTDGECELSWLQPRRSAGDDATID